MAAQPAASTSDIVDNAALVFNRSNALTYAGLISWRRHRHEERHWNADPRPAPTPTPAARRVAGGGAGVVNGARMARSRSRPAPRWRASARSDGSAHRAEWRHAGARPEPGHAWRWAAWCWPPARVSRFELQHAGRRRRQRTDRATTWSTSPAICTLGRHAGHRRRPFGRLLPALQLWRARCPAAMGQSAAGAFTPTVLTKHRQSGQSVAARRRAADAVLGRQRPDRQRHRQRRQRNLEQRRHQLDRHAGPGRHQRSDGAVRSACLPEASAAPSQFRAARPSIRCSS